MQASNATSDCDFCQIVAGGSHSAIFCEDEVVLSLVTIGPTRSGHAMIIPREHAASLADLDEDVGCQLWTVTQRTAAALRKSGLPCEGVNLFLADGEAAFQEVFHVHMHVFPRFEGDGSQISADWHRHPSRSELDRAAKHIRTAYERIALCRMDTFGSGTCIACICVRRVNTTAMRRRLRRVLAGRGVDTVLV